MRALVVFESMFGNTEAIARAIADGLSPYAQVDITPVHHAPEVLDADVDLLVVGGPTHAFGMSRPSTRQAAADQGAHEPAAHGIGLREWLGTISQPPAGLQAASFDTRVAGSSGRPKAPGSAARKAAKRLRALGLTLVAAPTSFLVSDTSGPLLPDELARAHRWGADIGTNAQRGQPLTT